MHTVDVEAISRSALDTTSNLFQSSLWAGAKARLGEEPLSFRFRYSGRWYPLLVVVRPLGEGYRAGYIPWGPDLRVPESEQAPLLEQLAAGVAPLLPDDVAFLRFDLPWQSPYQREGEEEPPNRVRELRMNFGTESRNLRKAPTDVQPTDTLVIDPRRGEREVLADMRAKTRYNIRLARRRGVVVEEHPHADLAAWYELYRETMERKGLTVHEYRYFEALFRAADMGDDAHGELKLLLARRGEELLAGMVLSGPDLLIVVALLAVATYLGAVYVDYRHLRGRDADWTPTSWVYSVGLVFALLTLGLSALVFTPYHLSRRRAAVGLPT